MARLLDTFCKAGGATRGYQLVGFEVVFHAGTSAFLVSLIGHSRPHLLHRHSNAENVERSTTGASHGT